MDRRHGETQTQIHKLQHKNKPKQKNYMVVYFRFVNDTTVTDQPTGRPTNANNYNNMKSISVGYKNYFCCCCCIYCLIRPGRLPSCKTEHKQQSLVSIACQRNMQEVLYQKKNSMRYATKHFDTFICRKMHFIAETYTHLFRTHTHFGSM